MVTLAKTGGKPTANSAGYDTSEASPATEASNPAAKPAIIKKINVRIIGRLTPFQFFNTSNIQQFGNDEVN